MVHTYDLNKEQMEVLQRGLTFSPSNNLDSFTSIKDTHLFARKVVLKKLHASKNDRDLASMGVEEEALEALISLEEENMGTREEELTEILEKALSKGLITKKLLEQIRDSHPRFPTLYLIPKIHKNELDPPGRPIVADSSHPISTVRGIPVGQFLRARRICSDDHKFESQAIDLARRFTQRGYSKRMIKRGYIRASRTARNQLLYKDSAMIQKQRGSEEIRLYLPTTIGGRN
ncbi:uncharacterized protein [Ranitomeya imitator]|uniref:uncharacterized protein n=1 Tax=Ranitomeya imitator TaxID=111125 RepID=UPI0037E7D716